MILIRSARGEDVEDVVRIYVESWNAGFAALMPTRTIVADVMSHWTRDLAKPVPHRWWVAETDEVVVGFAGICPSRDPIDPAVGELDTIAVDPVRWRAGIGRTLMMTALEHLAGDGYREAILWTLADYERGQRFYEATGWKVDGGMRDGGRQIRYRHDLKQEPRWFNYD